MVQGLNTKSREKDSNQLWRASKIKCSTLGSLEVVLVGSYVGHLGALIWRFSIAPAKADGLQRAADNNQLDKHRTNAVALS